MIRNRGKKQSEKIKGECMKNIIVRKDIKESFEEECTAIIRYMIYADIAESENEKEAAELFRKMATNEIEHAKIWCKQLEDFSKDTIANLQASAMNENTEWKSTYPQKAQNARNEGYEEIAVLFERVASIECDHERKFLEQAMAVGNGIQVLPDKLDAVQHYCIFCGHSAAKKLEICPVCGGVDSF